MGYRTTGLQHEPYLGMSERPGMVGLVYPGGPADRAGLRAGDRILSINGIPAADQEDMPAMLRRGGPDRGVFLSIERDGTAFAVELLPEPQPMPEILWLLAHALVAIATLFIGTIVFLRKAGRLTGAFYALCLVLAALLFRPWVPPGTFGERFDILTREFVSALFPGVLVHFFLLFPWERAPLRRHPWLQVLPYVPGFFLLAAPRLALRLPAGALPDARTISLVISNVAGLSVLTALAISGGLFCNAYRRSPLPTVRRKLKVALAGTILGILPLLLVLALTAVRPGANLPAIGGATLALFLLPASFGYAIIRHGIFDLEFLVKRSLAWSAVAATAVLCYLALHLSLRGVLHAAGPVEERIGGALIVAIVVLLMSPLRGHLQERIDRWIDPDRSDAASAARIPLRPASGLDDTERSILEAVHSLLGTMRAGFFRPISGGDSFRLTQTLVAGNEVEDEASARGPNIADPPAAPTITAPSTEPAGTRLALGRLAADTLYSLHGPVFRGEFEAELPYGYLPRGDLEALAVLETKVLLSFAAGERRLGLLVLGPRAFGTPYADSDLTLLEGLQTRAALALEAAHYHLETKDSEGLHRELAMAGSVQQKLLPGKLPELRGFDLAASTVPCREVGGDFYDCLLAGPDDLAIAIGDVTGKGVPAALVMASLQATFRAELAAGLRPRELVARANRSLCGLDAPERFVTFFHGRLDLDRSLLAYTNAGHLHPILVRADGRVERLDCGGLLLGVLEESLYQDEVVPLRPGDLLVLFTDGVIERGGAQTQFEEPELLRIASAHRHLSAADILGRITEELAQEAGVPADDDTTLFILKAL
jgi:sigma-B regulation protein RsbU (phosphoserine phosphatase)